MKTAKQKKILHQATKLLERNGIRNAPVDVEQVAGSLGIQVRKSPTDDDISGFLLRQPSGPALIGVNTLHHPNRQRFTVAHELGHFLLHAQDAIHVDHTVVKLRSGASSTGEDPDEVEANRFAAELLMPRSFLKRDLQEGSLHDFLDDRRMQLLAKQYQVSVQAMTRRLISLGYISADQQGNF